VAGVEHRLVAAHWRCGEVDSAAGRTQEALRVGDRVECSAVTLTVRGSSKIASLTGGRRLRTLDGTRTAFDESVLDRGDHDRLTSAVVRPLACPLGCGVGRAGRQA